MVWSAVVLSVLLSFPFGNAEATALSTVGGLTFEVRVEVNEPASAVLVRGVGLVDELPPVSLVDHEDGTWAGIVELPIVENILIGFELIPPSGPSVISDLHRLTDYGIDPAVFETGRTPEPELIIVTETAEPPAWLWLVLAGGAGILALILIGVWVWAGGKSEDDDAEGPDDGQSSAGSSIPTASDPKSGQAEAGDPSG